MLHFLTFMTAPGPEAFQPDPLSTLLSPEPLVKVLFYSLVFFLLHRLYDRQAHS